MDAAELGFDLRVVVLEAADAPEDFGEVERLHRDAGMLHQLLAEADGVERCRPGPEHAHADVAQAFHDAASGGEGVQVRPKGVRPGRYGM